MLIRVRELELRKLEFDENYQPGAIEFGPDFRQVGPLHSAGRAELIVEHRGHHQNVEDIRLVGNVKAHLEFSCARCLEPVVEKIDRQFNGFGCRSHHGNGIVLRLESVLLYVLVDHQSGGSCIEAKALSHRNFSSKR